MSRLQDKIAVVTGGGQNIGRATALALGAAGGGRTVAPTREADPDQWLADLDLNIKGTFLCGHAVLPSMVSRGSGPIVNLASRVASGEADALTGRYITAKDNLDEMIARADEVVGNDAYKLRLNGLTPPVASTEVTAVKLGKSV